MIIRIFPIWMQILNINQTNTKKQHHSCSMWGFGLHSFDSQPSLPLIKHKLKVLLDFKKYSSHNRQRNNCIVIQYESDCTVIYLSNLMYNFWIRVHFVKSKFGLFLVLTFLIWHNQEINFFQNHLTAVSFVGKAVGIFPMPFNTKNMPMMYNCTYTSILYFL